MKMHWRCSILIFGLVLESSTQLSVYTNKLPNKAKQHDFAVIIQGPLSPISLRHVPTYVRQVDEVVISYWSGDALEALLPPTSWISTAHADDCIIKVAVSEPPNLEHLPVNMHSALLQTVNTLAALKMVDSQYVIKTRSDEYFANLAPLKAQVLREGVRGRLTTINVVIATEPFRHISDHCFAGQTRRLLIALELVRTALLRPGDDASSFGNGLGAGLGGGAKNTFQGVGGGVHFAESLIYEAFVLANDDRQEDMLVVDLSDQNVNVAGIPARDEVNVEGGSRQASLGSSRHAAVTMAQAVVLVPVSSLHPYVISSSRLPALTAGFDACIPRDPFEDEANNVNAFDDEAKILSEGACHDLTGIWPFPSTQSLVSCVQNRQLWDQAVTDAMMINGDSLLRASYSNKDSHRFGHRVLVTYESTSEWLLLGGGVGNDGCDVEEAEKDHMMPDQVQSEMIQSPPFFAEIAGRMSKAEAVSRDFLSGSLVWWGALCLNPPPRDVVAHACSLPPDAPESSFDGCSALLTADREKVVLEREKNGGLTRGHS